jgi:hypothetical protein
MNEEYKLYLFSNEKHKLIKPGITMRSAEKRLPEYLRSHPELPKKGWILETERALGTTSLIAAMLIEIAVRAVLISAGAIGFIASAGFKGINEVFHWHLGARAARKLVDDEVTSHLEKRAERAKLKEYA